MKFAALFLFLCLFCVGCATKPFHKEPYYIIEIYIPANSNNYLMGVKIPAKDVEYYKMNKFDERGNSWGKVTGPYNKL